MEDAQRGERECGTTGPAMRRDVFAGPLASLEAAWREIHSNVEFILQELPALDVDAGTREGVTRTCKAMDESLRFDVQQEAENLAAKLYPESGGLESGQNPDPRVTLDLIRQCVWSDLAGYDALVRSLPTGGQAGEQSVLSVLLLESGANMLAAWQRLSAALDTIRVLAEQDERWRAAPAPPR